MHEQVFPIMGQHQVQGMVLDPKLIKYQILLCDKQKHLLEIVNTNSIIGNSYQITNVKNHNK